MLEHKLKHLETLENILFDTVGSRTLYIGQLSLIFKSEGISIRVRDEQLPVREIELAYYIRKDDKTEHYLSSPDYPLIIDWVIESIDGEIARRQTELDNAVSRIMSIAKKEVQEAAVPNSME